MFSASKQTYFTFGLKVYLSRGKIPRPKILLGSYALDAMGERLQMAARCPFVLLYLLTTEAISIKFGLLVWRLTTMVSKWEECRIRSGHRIMTSPTSNQPDPSQSHGGCDVITRLPDLTRHFPHLNTIFMSCQISIANLIKDSSSGLRDVVEQTGTLWPFVSVLPKHPMH